MAEGKAHKRLKRKLAGKTGKTEVHIGSRRRIDVRTHHKAIEIERSGNRKRIKTAIDRLDTQRGVKKELRVPHVDLNKAAKIAKAKGGKITVKNLSGTKSKTV